MDARPDAAHDAAATASRAFGHLCAAHIHAYRPGADGNRVSLDGAVQGHRPANSDAEDPLGCAALTDDRHHTGTASNATAAFVNVECSSVVGAFSDAAFTLLGGAPPTTITFTAQAAFEKGEFVAALRVRSLRDSYR